MQAIRRVTRGCKTWGETQRLRVAKNKDPDLMPLQASKGTRTGVAVKPIIDSQKHVESCGWLVLEKQNRQAGNTSAISIFGPAWRSP